MKETPVEARGAAVVLVAGVLPLLASLAAGQVCPQGDTTYGRTRRRGVGGGKGNPLLARAEDGQAAIEHYARAD